MAEYTFENLIINPETPGLERLIGKEVYCGNVPIYCLRDAEKNRDIGMLIDILKDDAYPFRVKDYKRDIRAFACIIPKKEEPKPKSKFIPFKSAYEFFDAYGSAKYSIKKGTVENKLFYCGGIWLKDKDIDDVFYMVTEIWRDGVVLGSDQSTTKWDDLLYGYTFLDGTPCGKLAEEDK